MSESKARLESENQQLRKEKEELTFKLVRLLAYTINLQEDHPDIQWPEFPDSYSDMVWRYAA